MKRLKHETRILVLALGAAVVPATLSLWALARAGVAPGRRWFLLALVLGVAVGLALAARAQVLRSLRALTGVVSALREEDFSVRVPEPRGDDALGELGREMNLLADLLREQRLGVIEASALLRKVIHEIDIAVLAFDQDGQLRLCNPAAERLLGRPSEQVLGLGAEQLGLQSCFEGPVPRTLVASFPGGPGPWELRRARFRERGLPNVLLVLTDLRRALREEERAAWQSLIRVLGHEINNSLAPIQSIARNLEQLVERRPRPADADEDLGAGLAVIARRSEALGRFLAGYARLARLPPPTLTTVDVSAWINRVVALEPRLPVIVEPGPVVSLRADADQLDQLLINLVRNGVDAALETGGTVSVSWRVSGTELTLGVRDGGPGLAQTTNLFVPFFTTKPDGSGIGLVLCRQIAEAHGGALTLRNRDDGVSGCDAHLRLPL